MNLCLCCGINKYRIIVDKKHNNKLQGYQHQQTQKSDTSFSWASMTQTFKII